MSTMHLAAAAALALTTGLALGTPMDAVSTDSGTLDLGIDRVGEPTQKMCFDLAGVVSWDSEGDVSNFAINQFLGEGTTIVAIEWNGVELSTAGSSFLSEAAIGLNGAVTVRVGAADNFSGSGVYSSGGLFDLLANDMEYVLGADGMLSMEFFETQDDAAGAADAFYAAGELCVYYIPVPTPGSTAMLGMAGLLMTTRRRR